MGFLVIVVICKKTHIPHFLCERGSNFCNRTEGFIVSELLKKRRSSTISRVRAFRDNATAWSGIDFFFQCKTCTHTPSKEVVTLKMHVVTLVVYEIYKSYFFIMASPFFIIIWITLTSLRSQVSKATFFSVQGIV